MSGCPVHNPSDAENLFQPLGDSTPTKVGTECRKDVYTPCSLSSMYVELLREYLYNPDNIENDSLRKLLQSHQPLITTKAQVKETTVPRVVVERGEMQMEEMSILNQLGSDPRSGANSYITRWQVPHNITCVGGTYQEAELLSEEIGMFFHHFSQAIKKFFCLEKFRMVKIGAVQAVSVTEGATGDYSASIQTLSIAYDKWTLVPEASLLHRVRYVPDVS